MPIVVTCPKCPTKLSAPDTAAGKAVRCPKCGAAAPVPNLLPAEEMPVVEATVVPPKARPKPVVADAGDDDDRPRKKSRRDEEDADDDDRPRKKKTRDDDDDYEHDRRRKRRNARGGGGGGNGGLIAIGVIAGLLLLGGIGFGIYFLTGKDSPLAKKTPVPAGWEQYSYPQDGIKMYMPKTPSQSSTPVGAFGGFGGGRFGLGGVDAFGSRNDTRDAEALSEYSSGDWNDRIHITVVVLRYRNKVPSAVRDQFRNVTDAQWGGVETRKVRWLGSDAMEQTHALGVTRLVCTDRLVIMAMISGKDGNRAKPEEEAGFFDNFEASK